MMAAEAAWPRFAAVGAGRMGRGIAIAFAYAGHPISLVDLRERLIAAVLRIGPETLNSLAQAPAAAHALPPDRALTRAMQRIKAEGMDERGAQVDYPRLRASAALSRSMAGRIRSRCKPLG